MKTQLALPILAPVFACINLLHSAPSIGEERASSYPDSATQRHAYYGDLHLHTAYSSDAYLIHGVTVTPDQAYRYAKGEPIQLLGRTVRRHDLPLDFLAVTDHSENLGAFNGLGDPASPLYDTDLGQMYRRDHASAFWEILRRRHQRLPMSEVDLKPLIRSAWQREIEAANDNYQPRQFTTFIAYEWSSMPDGRSNMHRNVIFRGNTAPDPFSSMDSTRPEDLWSYLEANRKAGIEALAIPHNSNASNGLMYDWVDSDGKVIDQAYAQRRILNEPLSEICQQKGCSETHPALSATDEFSDFEIYEYLLGRATVKGKVDGSYIRQALGRGLELQQRNIENAFKFGVVGGSDMHSGLQESSEETYSGSNGGYEDGLNKIREILAPVGLQRSEDAGVEAIFTRPGSLTGVWAEENTRESIYDALRRKETFATSGTRLQFRFFGGWNYEGALLKSPAWVKTAYHQGVPMGGNLPARPTIAEVPKFLVWALKDPNGANLDRAQIVKVWLRNDKYAEKVFDVAYAGKRKPNPKTGKLPPVGNTVDLKTASYRNSIGATELGAVWQDPEFDPKLPAVYYLRIIEIPTPRWSTILAVKYGLEMPQGVPATLQERGWSSPIWYTPGSERATTRAGSQLRISPQEPTGVPEAATQDSIAKPGGS